MVDHLALADEFEVHPVGVDQVGIGRLVALALLDAVALQLDDILRQVLRFRPAERHAVAVEQEIRHPAFGTLGFVDDAGAVVDAFEQSLQGRAVAVLRRVAAGIDVRDFFEIACDVHSNTPLPHRF
ncbi:hypothetical protein [Qipengyuania sp. JC766]|uniref:hypothetical protein n=1 Tax=Qipengyuania sp. JC766 TaxID=3232139 RepID=UPI003457969F